jgi:hypothetical protein
MRIKVLSLSTTALVVALALSACDGGGGSADTAPSAGTTTVGTITGFGSVFVNGVEFKTSSARIVVNKLQAAASNLKVGMVVTVQGQVNADGSTGDATSIQYTDELKGLVVSNGIVAPSTTGVIIIMGQRITVTANTVFASDVKSITTISQIVPGNIVEVSGTVSGPGSIEATRIEVTAATLTDHLVAHDSIEVKGVISALDTTALTFKLGDMVVDYHTLTASLPAGFANGIYVEVKSVAGIVNGQLVASSISLEDDGKQGYQGHDGEGMDVKGTISRAFDGITFDVNGTTVIVDSATRLKDLKTSDLIAGTAVKVEGAFNATGKLVATQIQGHGHTDHEIHGTVASVTLLTPNSVNTGTITLADNTLVQVNNDTIMMDDREDDVPPDQMFNLTKLVNGDSIEAEVYTDSNNNLVAVRLKRENPGLPH